MTILFDHMDIHSENQKTCRGDDYLSIQAKGSRKYFCGKSPTEDGIMALVIKPRGKDSRVQFSFRTNNDGDGGSGVQLLYFAGVPMEDSMEDDEDDDNDNDDDDGDDDDDENESCPFDHDCGGNGVCVSGTCACDSPYSGKDCKGTASCFPLL